MRTTVSFLSLLALSLSSLSAREFTVEKVFPNLLLVEPIAITHPGDSSNLLFVAEQPGVIKVFENDPEVNRYGIFLDLRSKLISGGELGLLGLVFDPDYENNGYFYVNYTAPNPLRTVISRFRVQADNPRVADTASEMIILTFPQPGDVHKGGQLLFGPDGYLYISSGDGKGAGDPLGNGQNLGNLLGKILRIDVANATIDQPYTIPVGNPYYGSRDRREEIYAHGLRNPWRFSIDPVTSRLWCGDVGQDAWEEVNIIEPGGNYGWSIMEGFHCFGITAQCDSTGLTLPLWEYEHGPTGGYAVTGGYVYRGPTLTSLEGKYIYGDFASGRIWAIEYDGASPPINTLIASTEIPISSFGLGPDDELYICSYHGAIYKLVQPAAAPDERSAAGLHLAQSLPNPATSIAVITYTLDRPASVQLTLHDVMGRELLRVVDREQDAGEHSARLDTKRFPAGAYYYRLTAGGRSATGRMVITK